MRMRDPTNFLYETYQYERNNFFKRLKEEVKINFWLVLAIYLCVRERDKMFFHVSKFWELSEKISV